MGIPTIESQRRDPRTVVGRHQLGGAARHQLHRAGTIGARLRFHVVALGCLVELQALRQRRCQRGIATIIKFDKAHRGSTSGVVGPMARPLVTLSPLGNASSARLSQPDCTRPGPAKPLSSTSCPSKCERSRYGVDTAWMTAACFSLYIRANSGIEGCSAKKESSIG